MKLLLRLGMDVESPDKEGKSPVQLAIDKQYVQHESIKKVLIQVSSHTLKLACA
eukprot:SAG31_NODE_1571_length_7851_cov_8.714525_8_plen_54_part_00